MRKFFLAIFFTILPLFGFSAASANANEPIYTARTNGQGWRLEEEACRFVGTTTERGEKKQVQIGDVIRLDCRELKESGLFVDPSSVPDERDVVVYNPAIIAAVNAFQGDSNKSIWISTLSSWWTLDRQGNIYSALIVQILEGDDTPYQQMHSDAQRLVIGQEALLINPDPAYTQLWKGMSQCGYPSPNFMVLLEKEGDYVALSSLISAFAREAELPSIYVSGCDVSGLYNFVHSGNGSS